MSKPESGKATKKSLDFSCNQCALSALCLTRDLAGPERERFDQMMRRHHRIERGEKLFFVGNKFKSLYVLHSGSAKACIVSESGEEQVIGFYLAGELIGFDGLNNYTHSCSVELLESGSACELPIDELDELMGASKSLRRRFHTMIGNAFVEDHKMLLMLGKLSSEQRFAWFLLNLSDRFARLKASPTEFNLSMSRYDIANYLGLANETISRLIKRYSKEGIVEVNRRWVRILDIGKLRQYLQFNVPRVVEPTATNT